MDSASISLLVQHVTMGSFLLFCRIGACLMLAPGFSNSQIPTQIRLFAAISATIAMAPVLFDKLPNGGLSDDPKTIFAYLPAELMIGISIGLLSRLFLTAFETLSVSVATNLGLANVFGAQFDLGDELPPLATFITLAATSLIFIMDLHWQILKGLEMSYDVIPIDGTLRAALSLKQIADTMSSTFFIALRVSSPFIAYSLLANLAVSLINKLTPQIAIFYISTPFILAGGLLLLYYVLTSSIFEFMVAFSNWLSAR